MQNQQDLQSVLNEMFAAEKKFSFDVVRGWQNRYPQFSSEIAQAVAAWREFEFFALEDEETPEPAQLSEIARAAMENALAQFRLPLTETIADLRELAKERGVAREILLQTLGVSETLMRKIDRRILKEVPLFIEEKLAEVLRVSTESLQAFFNLPSVLPQKANYKSKTAPQTQPKQTFAEAVKNDPELSTDEKARLLDLTESEKLNPKSKT